MPGFITEGDAVMRPSTKRAADTQEAGIGGRSSGTQEVDAERITNLERQIATLTHTVGEGVHAAPVQVAVKKELVAVGHRLADIEHAVYYSWEVPTPHKLAEEIPEWRRKWEKKRDEARMELDRDKKNIGHVKNYIFMGVLNTLVQAEQVPEETRTKVMKKILALVGNGQDPPQVVPDKVRHLDRIVAHCQCTLVPKGSKMFLNIRIRDLETEMAKLVYDWLDTVGKRQYDPPPLRPSTRAIRDTNR